MTGEEHYKRAEDILAGRNGHQASLGVEDADQAIALAQVHATLALAAATAADYFGNGSNPYGGAVAR